MSAAVRLRVVAGRQRGASVALAAGSARVLGRDLEADIVLREPGLAARAIGLRVDEDGEHVALESLVDGVSVDGEPLAAGDVATLAPGATIALGSLALAIEPGGADGEPPGDLPEAETSRAPDADDDPVDTEPTAGAAVAPAKRGTSVVVEGEGVADGADANTAAPAGTARRRSPLVTLGLVATIVCVALAGWLWFGKEGVAEGPALAARLEAAFPALALERQTGQPGVVRGFVADRGESIRLERWLAAQPERASSAVLVDTELAERVEDVLRTSGVEATVRSLVAGAAVVDVSMADADELERIEARVREDVPQLVALTLDNTPPPPVEKVAPTDPGKRVELVVATDPAYVVTRDRSRYFVGSLLPSGHRIAAIEEGILHLEKGDVRTELKF